VSERLPQAIESSAYFLAAEALTNVAKYVRARIPVPQSTR